MGWLTAVANILGLIDALSPLIEKLLNGFASLISGEAAKLSPGNTSAADTLAGWLDSAAQGVAMLDGAAVDTAAWLKETYPTIEALIAAFGGIDKMLYNANNLMGDNKGMSLSTAINLNQSAHATARTAAK